MISNETSGYQGHNFRLHPASWEFNSRGGVGSLDGDDTSSAFVELQERWWWW